MARRHKEAKGLGLPADLISESVIERVVDVWLETPFDAGRHERRIDKITAYENNGHPGE